MPFGLSCAPLVFQCLISNVLREMLGKFIIAYIHGIFIYSHSLESQVNHVKKVLSHFLKHQFQKVKLLKSESCPREVALLEGVTFPFMISTNHKNLEDSQVI